MCRIDDFDTQIQSDELYLRMKAGEYTESEQELYDSSFWDIYDVDCDDGTKGDIICVPKMCK